MVGEKLEELLKAKKIKAGTLATMTGISRNTIYSIIRRNNKNVAFSNMEKIADALGVPVEYFYDSEPAEDIDKNKLRSEDTDISELINMFNRLDDNQKQFILSAMRGILKDNE